MVIVVALVPLLLLIYPPLLLLPRPSPSSSLVLPPDNDLSVMSIIQGRRQTLAQSKPGLVVVGLEEVSRISLSPLVDNNNQQGKKGKSANPYPSDC